MRLLVTEFITGGGVANDPLPEYFRQEGQLMLQAVLEDCSKINNLQLVTTLDARVELPESNVEVHIVENAIDYMQQLALISQQCDATWVIAPESGGILETIIKHLKNEKITLINSDAESVNITTDKLLCEQHLKQNGILVVESLTYERISSYADEVIIKSRYGAGCEGLMKCINGQDALDNIDDYEQWVVQPYMEGEHISMSVVLSEHQVCVLSVNQQDIRGDKKLKLHACIVNKQPISSEIISLAKALKSAIPGLRGYVGIDLILSDNKFYVVDINPRLTSSYVGLSEVLEDNPAKICIDSIIHSVVPESINKNTKVIEINVA